MKNITVSVSDDAYIDARIWAAQHETSLSKIVQYFITTLPRQERAELKFPRRHSGANVQNFTQFAENTAYKQTFRPERSAPTPTF
jgi:hypothetical protein